MVKLENGTRVNVRLNGGERSGKILGHNTIECRISTLFNIHSELFVYIIQLDEHINTDIGSMSVVVCDASSVRPA